MAEPAAGLHVGVAVDDDARLHLHGGCRVRAARSRVLSRQPRSWPVATLRQDRGRLCATCAGGFGPLLAAAGGRPCRLLLSSPDPASLWWTSQTCAARLWVHAVLVDAAGTPALPAAGPAVVAVPDDVAGAASALLADWPTALVDLGAVDPAVGRLVAVTASGLLPPGPVLVARARSAVDAALRLTG